MAAYKVFLPHSSLTTGEFNNLHWSELEQANKIPIIVYMLKPISDKSDNNQQSKRHSLYCVRTPSLKTLKSYNFKNICHLLLLSPSHVCYVHDIEKYMRVTLGKPKHNARCRICFNCYLSQQELSDHLNNGICASVINKD